MVRWGWLAFLLVIIGVVVYGEVYVRPGLEAKQVAECRSRYAAARTASDSMGVDAHMLPRFLSRGYTTCSAYRQRGRL